MPLMPQMPQGQPAPQVQPPAGQPPQGQPAGLPPGQPPGPAPVDAAPAGVPPPEQVSDPAGNPVVTDVTMENQGQPASPQEQKEYERATAALHEVLYGSPETSNSVVKALQHTPESKIDPLVKTSIMIMSQLDEKIDLDENIISQMAQDVVGRLIEMAEVRYNIEYSDVEMQQALGATWEGVTQMFGADEQDYQNFMSTTPKADIETGAKVYRGALNG